MNLGKQILVYGLGRILPAAIGFGALLVYANVATVEQYGLYASCLAAANILNLSLSQWIRITNTRFLAVSPKRKSVYLRTCGLLYVSGYLVSLLVVTVFEYLVFGELRYSAYVVGMYVALSLSDFVLELQRVEERVIGYSIQYFIRQVLTFFSIISLLSINSASAFQLGFMIGNVLPLIGFFGVIRTPRRKVSGKRLKTTLRRYITYGLPLAFSYAVSSILNAGDRLVVTLIAGTTASGVYAMLTDIAKQLVMTIMEAVNLATFPAALKRYKKGDIQACYKQLGQNIEILLYLSIPVVAAIAALHQIIVIVALSPDYHGYELIMLVGAIATFLRGLRVCYFDQAYQLSATTKVLARNALVSMALWILMLPALVWTLGIYGAALGVLLTYALALALSLLKVTPEYKMPWPWRELGKAVACSSGMFTAMVVVANQLSVGLEQFAMSAAVGGVVYVVLCILINAERIREYIVTRS